MWVVAIMNSKTAGNTTPVSSRKTAKWVPSIARDQVGSMRNSGQTRGPARASLCPASAVKASATAWPENHVTLSYVT